MQYLRANTHHAHVAGTPAARGFSKAAARRGAACGVVSHLERRREARRQVGYPLRVVLPTDGPPQDEQTTVQDINSRGAFFYHTNALPAHGVVELHILLSRPGDWGGRPVEVQAEGRVVRTLPQTSATHPFGTAVEFVRPPTLLLEQDHDD